MTRIRIRICYELFTPESLEDGETAETGFVIDGWPESTVDGTPSVDPSIYWHPGALRDALKIASRRYQIREASCRPLCTEGEHPCWWIGDPIEDPITDETIRYSLHIDGITQATRRRINRWLRGE